MQKKIIIFAGLLFCCVLGGIVWGPNLFVTPDLTIEYSSTSEVNSENVPDTTKTEESHNTESTQYSKYIKTQATEYMPSLSFELIGEIVEDDIQIDFYYPVKLIVKTDEDIIQEFEFDADDFAPCTLDMFGFEYGDFKFDGYGGFKILSTSMGKNPSYYFWVWDKDKDSFVRYQDLEMVGDISFDYDNQMVNIISRGSATGHEFLSYKYIDGKLTLIEKIVDPDQEGKRQIYKLIDGELKLIEILDSQFFN